MRKLYQLLICLIVPFTLTAQLHDIKFKAGNFKKNPEGFKFAVQKLAEGNQHIQNGEYGAALSAYLSADSINPSNADLNAKIGVCYLNLVNKAQCLSYFRTAHAIKKKISKRIDYFLARGYQLNSQWDSAIIEYNIALKNGSSKDKTEINKEIDECNNGNDLTQHPIKVTMENMGENINSPFSDLRPFVTNDGKLMLLTSCRHSSLSTTDVDPTTGEYSQDIYIGYNRNGVWDTAQCIDPPVNTVDNDVGICISPDGKTLYFVKETRGGDIYKSNYSESSGWSVPVALSDTINSIYTESSMCFSPDGKTIFFVSNRPGGIGGKDIYTSTLGNDSNWSTPVNLGASINTPYDEDGVFMNPDGKTLYFSSKGHNSMGGYDVFMTVNEGGKWSEPKNLGYPINTPDDDVYFTTSNDGMYGYYARATDKNKLDIYRVTMNAFMPKELVYKGTITDSASHQKLKVTLEFFDKATGNSSPFGPDSVKGEYSLTLPAGHNFALRIKAKGYKDYSSDINVADTAMFRTVEQNIALVKSGPASPMSDSCLPKIAVLMERFKGVVKDTVVMKNAVAQMDASFCLKNLRFTIQLGVFHSTQKFNYREYVKKAESEKLPDGTTRITTGSYLTYEEAHKELESIKHAGLKDVFIIGTCNGKRYVLKNLLHPAN